MAGYITSTFPDTKVAQALGATFFSLTEQLVARASATMVAAPIRRDEGAQRT